MERQHSRRDGKLLRPCGEFSECVAVYLTELLFLRMLSKYFYKDFFYTVLAHLTFNFFDTIAISMRMFDNANVISTR